MNTADRSKSGNYSGTAYETPESELEMPDYSGAYNYLDNDMIRLIITLKKDGETYNCTVKDTVSLETAKGVLLENDLAYNGKCTITLQQTDVANGLLFVECKGILYSGITESRSPRFTFDIGYYGEGTDNLIYKFSGTAYKEE